MGQISMEIVPPNGSLLSGNQQPLGSLTYAACASPDFIARFFPHGVDAAGLAKAPCLRFDRRDGLQARWVRHTLGVELDAPSYSVASTHAFIDLAAAGVAWGMQPVSLAESHLVAGTLVELVPDTRLAVALNWIVARLPVASLDRLTDAVRSTARIALR